MSLTVPTGTSDARIHQVRSWLILGIAAVLLATTCVFLGLWQWGRHEDRSARIEQIERAYNAPAVPVSELLDSDGSIPADIQWHPVTLTGHYVGDPVLVRNRPVGLGSGFHVLGVMELEDGSRLVINRGYLPTKLSPEQVTIPPVHPGTVTLTGRVRSSEPNNSRGVVGNQVYTFSPEQVIEAAGLPEPTDGLVRYSYVVAAESGADSSAGMLALPAPSTDIGSHLSYAFQWWIFATGILGLYVVLALREFRSRRLTLDDLLDDEFSPASAHKSSRKPKKPRIDEDAEDAAVSSQLQ